MHPIEEISKRRKTRLFYLVPCGMLMIFDLDESAIFGGIEGNNHLDNISKLRLLLENLQVILNKDTPVQCDPNVLPEPNHVMLNHLYALSIKDGVMVLSATHRYRKKYVTTLLYKPI